MADEAFLIDTNILVCYLDGDVITASALERDATLVTRNVRDFRGMPLSVYNPFEGYDGQ